MSSLEESIRLEWNGDVDFGDGKLQQLYKSYCQRLRGLEYIDFSKFRSHPQLVLMALNLEGSYLTDDLKFLTDGMFNIIQTWLYVLQTLLAHYLNVALKNASDEYASKVESGSTEKILYSLGWKVDELTRLIQAGCKFFMEIISLQEILINKDSDLISGYVWLRLAQAKAELTPFIKRTP